MTERWEKLTNLFHAPLDRPPAERGAFLNEAFGGDAELVAEVESLLRAPWRLPTRRASSTATSSPTTSSSATPGS